MGRKKERRLRFLQAHPHCCFCGGDNEAVEVDHIPARSLFSGRRWPQGYEFPACEECNRSSANDELLLGMLCRIQHAPMSPLEEKELEDAIAKASDRHGDLLAGMAELTRSQTSAYFRKLGRTRHEIASALGSEPYVIDLPGEVLERLKRYGEKLAKALYYLNVGKIVPRTGHVVAIPLTNVSILSKDFPHKGLSMIDRAPIISRDGQSLEGQFSYRYAIPVEDGAAVFFVRFRDATFWLLCVYEDFERYKRVLSSVDPNLNGSNALPHAATP